VSLTLYPRAIFVMIIVCGLCACTNEQSGGPPKPPGHKILAQQRPAQHADSDASSAPSTPSVADSAPAAEAPPKTSQMPDPRKARIEAAAKVKSYTPIGIPDTDVSCRLITRWSDGHCLLRLAIVGSRQNLVQFVSGAQQFKLNICNGNGAVLHRCGIYGMELKPAPPSANNGVPTFQYDGSFDCALEEYEAYAQFQLGYDYYSSQMVRP